MVFSSGLFLIYFLPLALTLYFLIPVKFKNAFLLLVSLFFFWWGAPLFLWLVVGISVFNFYVAQQIEKSEQKKVYLWLYITANLLLLIYFKYFNFFVDNVNLLLLEIGTNAVEYTRVVLPLGISFFTFHSITYGVDVYRKEADSQKSLVNYCLYILFFPQLIAGPIVTYKSIFKQLEKRETSYNQVLDGFVRFTIGLGKKVLIANVLSEYGAMLAGHEATFHTHSAIIAWLGALAYTFEIYFDFSGYSDMAIGLAKFFGFRFPENFDRPYLSRSITEFWQRWHITLGNFMKNYLYIPLGGNRKGNNRTYANLATVFILSGLWHGAAWNFVLWGVFHGFWLVIERLLNLSSKRKWIVIFQIVTTFFIVLNGWVLFEASNLTEALQNYSYMYRMEDFTYLQGRNLGYYEIHLVFAAVICGLGLFPNLNKLYTFSLSETSSLRTKMVIFFCMGLIYLLSLSHVVTGSFNPFIYFKF